MNANEASIYIFAARCAHTRNTGAALMVVSQILAVWDDLPSEARDKLKHEAKEATCIFEDWWKLIELD